MTSRLDEFMIACEEALEKASLIRISLGGYRGPDDTLKGLDARMVTIKNKNSLSLTYHHKTRDLISNYTLNEGMALLCGLLEHDFRMARLCTATHDLVLDQPAGGKSSLKEQPASASPAASGSHNRAKERPLEAQGQAYLHALGITDAGGRVLKSGQDKYRQINRYIEIVGELLDGRTSTDPLRVADMGSGKGYLTFALYDILRRKGPVSMTGIEYRPDLVSQCNAISEQSGFAPGLSFRQGTIQDFDATGIDVLIALHACDTATDDAIYKGIVHGARLIVVAPCCHKQVRREMEAGGAARGELEFLLRHGIFLERQAEMVTDALRALMLEYAGYRVKVFEFISDAHTPKNVMIVAEKSAAPPNADKALEKVWAAKARFGIAAHHLEKLLGL